MKYILKVTFPALYVCICMYVCIGIPCSPLHQWRLSREGSDIQISWHHHLSRSHMVSQYRSGHKEVTAVLSLPESAEEGQLEGEAAEDFLSLCSGEPADMLYHSRVWQLYWGREKGSTVLFPLWRTFTTPAASAELRTLKKTTLTLVSTCSIGRRK